MSFNERGFTLIEVLISAVILFSAVAAGTLVFRGSMILGDKASATVRISDALPTIMERVREALMEQKIKGEGRFDEEISYSWITEAAKSSRNILSAFDETTGGLEYGRFKIALNNVRLIVGSKDGPFSRRKMTFRYQELTWSG